MRTTLPLDVDLARELKELAHQKDESFKTVVNRALRAGLIALLWPEKPKEYRLEPVSMGNVPPGIDLVKALELPDRIEGEALLARQAV